MIQIIYKKTTPPNTPSDGTDPVIELKEKVKLVYVAPPPEHPKVFSAPPVEPTPPPIPEPAKKLEDTTNIRSYAYDIKSVVNDKKNVSSGYSHG